MNLKSMVRQCMDMLGEEYSATHQEQTVLKGKLTRCINYAYERVARNYYHPIMTEEITLDGSCRIKKSLLSQTFAYLRGVKVGGVTVEAQVESGCIFVGSKPFSRVEITYSYIPPYMVKDSDEPCIPSGEISPQVYVFLALSIFMVSEGRSDDAVLYNAQADAALAGSGCSCMLMPQRRWQ
ncbi:MAG: hypothetical protein IKK58_02325 [Clostridia bacterium]|nr:hypothetical protein [Clostridia bacterium]